MVKEKLISEKEAILRIPAGDLTQLLLPSFDPAAKKSADVLARGLPASPGAAVGKPAFTAEEAVTRARAGESVILVRKETSPEDVDGMHSAAGILTSTGGMTPTRPSWPAGGASVAWPAPATSTSTPPRASSWSAGAPSGARM